MTKILLVDDDEDILHALNFFLKRKNFEVVAVADGSIVKATALQINPDIILMDINLNGFDGRILCQEIQKNNKLDIPIILFSGVSDYEETAAQYGASGFIGKPFEMKFFIEQLQSFLVNHKPNLQAIQ